MGAAGQGVGGRGRVWAGRGDGCGRGRMGNAGRVSGRARRPGADRWERDGGGAADRSRRRGRPRPRGRIPTARPNGRPTRGRPCRRGALRAYPMVVARDAGRPPAARAVGIRVRRLRRLEARAQPARRAGAGRLGRGARRAAARRDRDAGAAGRDLVAPLVLALVRLGLVPLRAPGPAAAGPAVAGLRLPAALSVPGPAARAAARRAHRLGSAAGQQRGAAVPALLRVPAGGPAARRRGTGRRPASGPVPAAPADGVPVPGGAHRVAVRLPGAGHLLVRRTTPLAGRRRGRLLPGDEPLRRLPRGGAAGAGAAAPARLAGRPARVAAPAARGLAAGAGPGGLADVHGVLPLAERGLVRLPARAGDRLGRSGCRTPSRRRCPR